MITVYVSSWRPTRYVFVQQVYYIDVVLPFRFLAAAQNDLQMFVPVLQFLIFLLHAAIIQNTCFIGSDEGTHLAARRTFLAFVFDSLASTSLSLYDHPHSFVEDVLEAILRQGTTLKISTLELLLDNSLGCFLLDWCVFRIFVFCSSFISQIDLISYEDFRHVRTRIIQLRIPLHIGNSVPFSLHLQKLVDPPLKML